MIGRCLLALLIIALCILILAALAYLIFYLLFYAGPTIAEATTFVLLVFGLLLAYFFVSILQR